MTRAYIALGSNLGDRRALMAQALAALGRILRVSSFYEAAPVGPPGQGDYLNAVAEIETSLTPEALLVHLQAIEAELGRVRTVKDGPRTIDLDILTFGNETRSTPSLTLPHPRLHERLFVLEPLVELAPGLVVHGKTVSEHRYALLGVRRVPPALRVLVTGSTSGIGKAIAARLASAGACIVLHGRRRADPSPIIERGGKAHLIQADLASDCDRLAAEAWDAFGGLDALVNNAGADVLTGDAAKWDFDRKLEALWNVDVKATLRLSRLLGQRMKTASGGTIINMGWDQAERGMEGDSGELFAATKGAIMCFSRSLALSLAPEVRVHCLAPGWIRTEWGEGASEAWQERVLDETPLATWGTPEDVASAVAFLLSPEARYINGQIVRVNGGAVR